MSAPGMRSWWAHSAGKLAALDHSGTVAPHIAGTDPQVCLCVACRFNRLKELCASMDVDSQRRRQGVSHVSP